MEYVRIPPPHWCLVRLTNDTFYRMPLRNFRFPTLEGDIFRGRSPDEWLVRNAVDWALFDIEDEPIAARDSWLVRLLRRLGRQKRLRVVEHRAHGKDDQT